MTTLASVSSLAWPEALHVVELGEQPSRARRPVGLEFLQRLPAEVVAIDEEEDARRTGVSE